MVHARHRQLESAVRHCRGVVVVVQSARHVEHGVEELLWLVNGEQALLLQEVVRSNVHVVRPVIDVLLVHDFDQICVIRERLFDHLSPAVEVF